MNSIIIKVNNAVKTVEEHKSVSKNDKPTIIKGLGDVNYQLINQDTGLAPQHIVTKRQGNDLLIAYSKEAKNADVVIEGFYEDDDSAIVGKSEDGSYYYYIPDTAEVADYVTNLVDGDVEGNALGGPPQPHPWWIGVADEGMGIWPWLLGLAGLGLLGAALADNEDDTEPKDTTAPSKPESVEIGNGDDYITADEIDENGNVNVTVELPDDAQVGDTVTVNDQDKEITQDDLDAGEVVIDVPAPAEGQKLEVEATVTDRAGNESDPVTDDATRDTSIPGDVNDDGQTDEEDDDDTTLNGAPIITFPEDVDGNNDKTLNATENGTSVDTTPVRVSLPANTEKNDKVFIKINNTQNYQEIIVKDDDITNGYVEVSAPVTSTTTQIKAEAFVKDPAGNQSNIAEETLKVDITGPANPTTTINLDKIALDNVLSVTEAEGDITIQGKAEGEFKEGDNVTVNVNGNDLSTTVASNGSFSIDVTGSELLNDDDTIISAKLTTTDDAGNTGTVTDSQDFIIQPTIKLSEDTGISNNDNISKVGKLTIDDRDDSIESVIAKPVNGDSFTIEKDTNGDYILNEGLYTSVTVTTTETTADNIKNTSANSFGPVEFDKTPSSAPTITPTESNSPIFDGNEFVRIDSKGAARIESSTNADTVIMNFSYTDETYNSNTNDTGIFHEATVTRNADGEWQWREFDGIDVSQDSSAVQSAILLESMDLNADGVDEAVVTITENRLLDGSEITANNTDISGNVSSNSTDTAIADDFTGLNYNNGPNVGDYQESAFFLDLFNGEINNVGFLDANGEFTQLTEDGVFMFDVTLDQNGNATKYGFSVVDPTGPANDINTDPNVWTYELIAFDSNGYQIYTSTQNLIEEPQTITP